MGDSKRSIIEIIESGFDKTGATAPYKIERTSPDVLLRHDISDEELDKLADTRRDYLWEGKWVALGVCVGVGPACFDELRDAYFIEPGDPLSASSTCARTSWVPIGCE